jgi:hypothetical protein
VRALRVPALVASVVVSALPLVVWTVSRTAGLSFGPQGGHTGGAGVSYVLSGALSLTTLAIAVVLLRRGRATAPWSSYGLAIALTGVLAATLIGIGGADIPVVGAFSNLDAHHAVHVVLPQG